MLDKQTDADWEWYGQNDPYFGVATSNRFRGAQLAEDARRVFFDLGEAFVEEVLELARQRLDGEFHPQRALDFGCGVGRVTLPLARRCREVVGVDVSRSMLEHAATNCREGGFNNVRFLETQELDRVEGEFDLVHSYIVFQHIPRTTGIPIVQRLIDLLKPNGIGVLHFTYRHHASRSAKSRLLLAAYRYLPFAYRLRKLLKKQPVMQMNEYNLNEVFCRIQDAGCGQVYARFTDHGCRGIVLMFQKKPFSL